MKRTPSGRVLKLGEKGSGLKPRKQVQDFYKLREEHLKSGKLFEDPEFPADDSSLFYSRKTERQYEWLRPREICETPRLFVDGYSRFDVQQGGLGDCWFLAAVANLTLYQSIFFQIVPEDQNFEELYAGIFHFRFWLYGKWIDVVIDDRLPTYGKKLSYLYSAEPNEFWSALLEKAYAKLYGSYEALHGGSASEAMEDFTGGVTEKYDMNETPPEFFKLLLKAYERSSMMGCSIEANPQIKEQKTPQGLIRGHAYSITRVRYVTIQTPTKTGKIPLLRIRNPWGTEAEWNGAWSDRSPEWNFIPEEERKAIGLVFDRDGEFWMSFKDFQTHFQRVEICNLTPDSLTEEELTDGRKKRWEMSVFEGQWVKGVTAGGCRNFLETFWHNPQYRISLTDVDEDDKSDEPKCTVIVALMQKNRRSKNLFGLDLLKIGYMIYHLPEPDAVPKPLDLRFFTYKASVAQSGTFVNVREVSRRFRFPPGTYCIVPSAFEPNKEGEFLLRIFSESKNEIEENDQDVQVAQMDEKVVQQAPTTEEEQQTDQVRQYFLRLAGEDMEVDWRELKEILDYAMRDEVSEEGFSNDICRSMVAMLDEDRTGKLGYEEFKTLWIDIKNWKGVFKMYDKDSSGALSGFELRRAFNSAGYSLNNRALNVLMHRYGNKSSELDFEDFVLCAVKVKSVIELFKRRDLSGENKATVSLEDWVETTLYS